MAGSFQKLKEDDEGFPEVAESCHKFVICMYYEQQNPVFAPSAAICCQNRNYQGTKYELFRKGTAEMNKKTKALTTEQYTEIIKTMREGTFACRPNDRVATALVLEGNLGLRISDILYLRLADIVRDGDRYRLDITEKKTGKQRSFTVPLVIYQYIENYCLRNGIGRSERIFPLTERAIQKQLAIVCDALGYEGIGTHSFRKWYATEIYKNNGYDIALVQRLLQHSSATITQRYIGVEPQRIEQAIEEHVQLI